MGPDSKSRADANTLRPKFFGLQHVLGGHNPVFQHLLIVVNIINKAVKRFNTLFEPKRNFVPFRLQDQPGDDVKRPLPVNVATLLLCINGKRDPHGPDRHLRSRTPRPKLLVRQFRKSPAKRAGAWPCAARAPDQFVKQVVSSIVFPINHL